MRIDQKLKIIMQTAGLTQEKLAQKIGVSFPTVNSWINNKSIPHKSRQKAIDAIYLECTGIKVIAETTLSAKKEIIKEKMRKHKNVLKLIMSRRDIYDQFILSLTYHSNRIEGSTLTEPETAAILFDNVGLPNKNIIEQLEVKNHQAALNYLIQAIEKKNRINEQFILKLHAILMNGIAQDAGTYRKHGVRIVGTNVPTANYVKISQLMKMLIKDIQRRHKDMIDHVSQIHSRFEQIHPFSDGNGRIGRLLIHAMLLKKNCAPAVIRQEKRRFYMKYLNKAQMKSEFEGLVEFLCDAILEGYRIIDS